MLSYQVLQCMSESAAFCEVAKERFDLTQESVGNARRCAKHGPRLTPPFQSDINFLLLQGPNGPGVTNTRRRSTKACATRLRRTVRLVLCLRLADDERGDGHDGGGKGHEEGRHHREADGSGAQTCKPGNGTRVESECPETNRESTENGPVLELLIMGGAGGMGRVPSLVTPMTHCATRMAVPAAVAVPLPWITTARPMTAQANTARTHERERVAQSADSSKGQRQRMEAETHCC